MTPAPDMPRHPDPPPYTASIPVLLRALQRLRAWLDVAEAHASRTGSSIDVLMRSRPAADMFPFGVQAQIVVNFTLRTAFPLCLLYTSRCV